MDPRDPERFAAGQTAIGEARRLSDRLTRLARVTTELARADSVETVTKIVITHSADAVGATIASLSVLEPGDVVHLVGLRGGEAHDAVQWERYPLATPTPSSDAIRTGERVMLMGEDALRERYAHVESIARGQRTVIALPMTSTGRRIGAIGLSFPGLRELDAAELEFFDILADTCAQAMVRIGAEEEARRQSARLLFLADASSELASSLDYQATLRSVAQLAVPNFADWCTIDLVDDGRLIRLAVEHVDPAKIRFAQEIAERWPSDPESRTGAWEVMRTGVSQLIPEVTEEMLLAAAMEPEQLSLIRELGLRSAITVPLVARERVLGVLTWVSAESDVHYTQDDLAFAENLAKRAAIAIDNAELHSETLAAAVRLQHAVLPDRMPELPGWEFTSHYSPAGRTEVGGDFFDAIPLGDGRVALFVGDVMGRGVHAAAAMAQMRAAVRAYAAVDPTPASVMENLDRMFDQFPSDQLVTLVYLVADPAKEELVVTNAGHPPPVLLRADGSTEQLPFADGVPLGTFPAGRKQSTVPFCAGDTLLAFTDGLIERRAEDIDAGQERLLAALGVLADPDLSRALSRVVDEVRDPTRDDDVAALVARRRA
jgi:serine phosphatase RsbU (regulator of sigma subunit)